MRKRRRKLLIGLSVVLGCVAAFILWMLRGLAPTPVGSPFYLRYDTPQGISSVLHQLKSKDVIREVGPFRIYALLHRVPNTLRPGTYQFHPGESADEIVRAIELPIRQMVRLPETNWAKRDANLLERANVTTAADYMERVHEPQRFKSLVSFPLPQDTLEGYLFPDTYDFPPLVGADAVVAKQLKTFQTKVWAKIPHPADLHRILTIASLIELEAGTKNDRYMISGVIQNRLKIGMPLQIDASLMYALGKWRRLHFHDYKDIVSPYNLYLHKGLPPTPICSPSLGSIEAAMQPAHHSYLFYVALPTGESLFSKTFEEHKKKIHQRLAALKVIEDLKAAASPTPAKPGQAVSP